MALTPSAAWTEAIRRSPNEPRYLVEINDGANVWRATNGITALSNVADGAVQGVAPLFASIDPISRKPQIGSLNVVVDDAWLRPRWVANRFQGKEITISLGAESLAEVDYLPYFRGVMEDILPKPTGNSIEIEILDAGTLMMRRKIVGFWLNQHPLETLTDIFAKAGVPASLIDSPSFLPANNPTIGQLVIQRGGMANTYYSDFVVRDPTRAWILVRQVLELVNGQLVTNEEGKLSFILFDPLGASVATWGEDTIETLEQLDTGNYVNRFHITFKRDSTGKYVEEFQLDDTDSQSDLAFPGTSERIYDKKFRTDWLDGVLATIQADINDTDTSIVISTKNLSAFSGARDAFPAASQPADAKVTGTRRGFLRIDDEIVAVTAIVFDDNKGYYQCIPDPENPGTFVQTGRFAGRGTFTIVRGQLGTTAVAHTRGSARVIDVTVPKFMAEPRIKRFGTGADRVRVVTPLHQYPVQYGDLVELDWSRYVNFGKDGITPADGVWEVVSKRVQVESEPPRISWELVFGKEVVSSLAGVVLSINDNNLSAQTAVTTEETAGFQPYAQDPGSTTDAGGLTASVEDVSVSNGTSIQTVEEAVTVDLTASSDNYIAVSTETGAVSSDAVPPGDPAPETDPDAVVVAVVTTDATAVTNVAEPTSDEQPTAAVEQSNVDTNENLDSAVPNSFFNKFQTFET